MPTNRTRRTRKMKQTVITSALRYYFETGSYDGDFPEEDRCDVFLLSSWPVELRAAWNDAKETILADWKRAGKRGLPWAVKALE